MAKTKAPLLSIRAQGGIGKVVTYDQWRGIQYARTWSKPTGPASTAQTEIRDIVRFLGVLWKALNQSRRDSWTAQVRNTRGTPFGALTKANLPTLQGDANLGQLVPTGTTAPASTIGTVTAAPTATPGQLLCTIPFGTLPTGWAHIGVHIVVFRDHPPTVAQVVDIRQGNNTAGGTTITPGGLGSGIPHVVSGYRTMTDPTGTTRWSPPKTVLATPL